MGRNAVESKRIVISALFTAIIAICSQLSFMTPFGIPITLQPFIISLCGYVLGFKWGTASVACYIASGSVGLPVFSGFRGGAQHLFSATGGYIWGFIIFAFLCGLSIRFSKKYIELLFGIIGLIICHIIGVIQFSFVTSTGVFETFITTSLPFFIKDLILTVGAVLISPKLKKAIF